MHLKFSDFRGISLAMALLVVDWGQEMFEMPLEIFGTSSEIF